MRTIARAGVLLALAVGTCACGGGRASTAVSDVSRSSPLPATSSATPASTRPVSASSLAARARGILVRRDDLPAGWRQKAYQPDRNQRQEDREFDMCLGVPLIDNLETLDLHSQFTTSSGLAVVLAEVTVVKTVPDAARDLHAATTSKAPGCLRGQLQRHVHPPKGARIASVAVRRSVQPAGYVGTRSIVTYAFANGSMAPIIEDQVAFVRGRAEVTVYFSSAFHAPDLGLEHRVMARVHERAETTTGLS